MKKRRRPISDINVVPYLDVMLVLLVIFMITAPLFNQGVVDLPSVGDKPLPAQEAGVLEIVYKPSGVNRFQLIDHEHGGESALLNAEELKEKLDEEKLLRPDAPVVISADAELKFGEVMELSGILRDLNYSRIGLNVKNGER
ncbi:MAG: biopolymer transporter ExbD [Gammaproteobacteria bacterium]